MGTLLLSGFKPYERTSVITYYLDHSNFISQLLRFIFYGVTLLSISKNAKRVN